MSSYVFAYAGGRRPQTDREAAAQMPVWESWFATLGGAIEQPGDPFGPAVTVSADGSCTTGAAGDLGGYTVVRANSLADAADLAKGCPILSRGGRVEVYEVVTM
jgi:YCII-related domain